MDNELTTDMRRVLVALWTVTAPENPGARIPLRRTASAALNGDTQKAAQVLAALDAAGYVRTDTMGWYTGWITEQGRQTALRCIESR